MDRIFSLFGLYDVLGYLLSGLTLIVGVWWVVEDSVPALSTPAFLGLLGASYIAGQLAATAGRAWERRWWHWRGEPRPRRQMLTGGGFGFGRLAAKSVAAQIEEEVGLSDLDPAEQFRLARAKLRMAGLDGQAQTMRALQGLCRNVAASSAMVGVAAACAAIFGSREPRLLVAAGLFLAAAPLFAARGLRFEHRFSREILVGYLALRMK